MLTRVGGLLLIVGSLVAVLLAILVLGGTPVGLGGTEVNGQYVVGSFALLAAGFAAFAFGRPALVGSFAFRLATGLTSAGSLLLAVSGVGGESTAIVAVVGLLFTAVGLLALGATLVRSPGGTRWAGAAILAGLACTVVGTIGPHEIQPVSFLGIPVVIAGIGALGILGVRDGRVRSTTADT